MEKRQLGNSDLELSVVGLGTWAIGGDGWDYGWGPQDERDSIACIVEAFEHGVNWVDTAPIYGIGRSEEVVGKALREWGEPVIVATKCGLIGDADGHVTPRLTRESVEREVEDSLRRLQIDVIDLYQIHWPKPGNYIEEAWQTLLDLKQAGKIRWGGVSNFHAEQLERVSSLGEVTSLQPPYSLLDRGIEYSTLPWCREHNTGVIAYSPIQNGILTGKVTREWIDSLPESDWRKHKNQYFQQPKLDAVLRLVDEMAELGESAGRSVAQLAVRWVIEQPGVTAAICGARRKGQIVELIAASDFSLSESERERLEQLSPRE